MDKKHIIMIAVGMVACVGVGVGLERLRALFSLPDELEVIEEETPRPDRIVKVIDEGAAYEAELLRRQVDELQRALATRRTTEAAAPMLEAAQDAPPDRRRGRQQPEITPEQREEMAARREEFRQRAEQAVTDRIDFLANLDTRTMTAPHRENHEKLIAAIARMNELSANAMDMLNAERQPDRQEMMELAQNMGDLYEKERGYLLEGLLGSPQLTDQVNQIYDNTSMPRGMGMMFGGGPGGGRGGPQGGGRAGGGGGRGGRN